MEAERRRRHVLMVMDTRTHGTRGFVRHGHPISSTAAALTDEGATRCGSWDELRRAAASGAPRISVTPGGGGGVCSAQHMHLHQELFLAQMLIAFLANLHV